MSFWSIQMGRFKRFLLLCWTHFYKVIVLGVLSLMALQYCLNMGFYGTKPYISVSLFYGTGNAAVAVTAAETSSGNVKNIDKITSTPSMDTLNTFNLTTTIGTMTNSSNLTSNDVYVTTELPICPSVPPKLVGRLKVWTNAPSWEELDQMYPDVEEGGRFWPKECVSRSKVAIIIPYRNRDLHLRLFLYNMHPMLMRQQLDYGIFVIEEAGDTVFNRAMLMNIGFVESLKLYDYQCFIFHDVDLVPEDDRNLYSCPEQPRHMSVAVDTMEYKLPYADIFGGVSALTKAQMEKVNGFSNEFWGWGGEDDDMSNRIRYHGYKISRYQSTIARYKMMKHTKDKPNPDRYNKLYRGKLRYKTDGINSLKYERESVQLKHLYTLVVVKLEKPKTSSHH